MVYFGAPAAGGVPQKNYPLVVVTLGDNKNRGMPMCMQRLEYTV